jgi:urease alpha subunit
MRTVSRQQYASLYGPTVGDRFRLSDTSLIAEIERSLLLPGKEAIYGGGKTLRDGMGQVPGLRNADGALDMVITSVIVMDPVLGVAKADIGIKAGCIVGIGQAGNPWVQDGVDPHMAVGAGSAHPAQGIARSAVLPPPPTTPFTVTWLMWAVITPAYRGDHGGFGCTTCRTTCR